MVRETIWMLLLVIGILSSLQSCDENVDKRVIHSYVYNNNSDYDINIQTFNYMTDTIVVSRYNVKKDSVFSQEVDLMFGSVTGIISYGDSAVITFNDRFQNFTLKDTSKFNILNLDNYSHIEISNNHDEYLYYFTNKDYDFAEDID